MDGGAGAIIALGKLLWDCYNRCKQASESFCNLHLDLLSLHKALKAVELSFTEEDLSPIQKIVDDIGQLISKYESLGTTKKKSWQRFRWHSADIAELRSRLISQVTILSLRFK